ncbi:hypothetical protein WJ0W_005467 [Paenibacillus melissococcoides]|uniref:Uncharacterized protein n=1 Tax=Paenibacillus melissococcoides TaxID=2912268 RepID=A0ABM9G8D0_9BACL|nr:hypothetical protein J6TS7_59610 [Paenibacillus dendritiformis]CAH8248209.1 hypothetical protein WJ0W_005467 [Paenibacillus melissococcoides]
MDEAKVAQLITSIQDDRALDPEASVSTSQKVTDIKSKVKKEAEKNLKKLHEKVILHPHIFIESPTFIHLLLSQLENIKRELEVLNRG